MTPEELDEIESKHQIDERHGVIDPDKDHLIAEVKTLLAQNRRLREALLLASECVNDAAFPKQSETIRRALESQS